MVDIAVAKFEDLADGDHRIFATHGKEVGVFRIGNDLYAWENHCPHEGGPVCQGKIFGQIDENLQPDMTTTGLKYSGEKNIVCPWHAYEFNIKTGVHPGDPNVRLKGVKVANQGGDIVLSLRG
jgi:nitrite reductase/ring-hydroxylating ferredoxin subunit